MKIPGPLLLIGINLNPARISKSKTSNIGREMAYAFQNFNDWTVDVWEWIRNFPGVWLLIVVGIKLITVIIM